METDDRDFPSFVQRPVDPVGRASRKDRVRKPELQAPDIEGMRLEAWRRQQRFQKELLHRKVGHEEAVVNATAAADLKLAALGSPFILKLERNAGLFSWVLLTETADQGSKIAARSEPFTAAGADEQAISARLANFLERNSIVL